MHKLILAAEREIEHTVIARNATTTTTTTGGNFSLRVVVVSHLTLFTDHAAVHTRSMYSLYLFFLVFLAFCAVPIAADRAKNERL